MYKSKPRWTHAQEQFLLDNYGTMKDEDIAVALGRSLKSVRRKREQEELIKLSGRGIVGKREDKKPAKQDYTKDLKLEN